VVVVYTDTPDALDDRERAVLTALGRAAATAINALEGRRLLAADDVVELDLELTDPDVFFVRLAASCELSYHGAVHRGDTLSLFFTAEGATGEEITERAAGCPDLSEVTVVTETEDTVVLECAVTPDSLVPLLADRGAETTDITASEGVGRIRVALPDRGEARATVEMVRERHPGTELVASRERQRPSRTRQEFVADLQDRLTDQQLTALRRAYLGGYFEHSRKVNGDDLAKSMGISRSTYHQHLRAAERKLVSAVLEDESRFR
jgi:predicted DNA binding protein